MSAIRVFRRYRQLKDVLFARVDLTAPQDGDVPTYDAGLDKLVMAEPAGGGGGPPSGPAGGDLAGTYPNPQIAASAVGTAEIANDAVTAAKIAGDAVGASEIAAGAVGTSELADGAVTSAKILDGTVAIGDLSFDPATQAELDVVANALAAHLVDPTDAHDASAVSSVPAGGLAATDVQTALNELDTEKAAAVHTHAGEDITSGTVADARIAASIARDSEVAAAIAASEAGQVRDGDAAGGVLGGTYPNPAFAVDMATQAELDAHVNDPTAAHAASAVSYAGAAGISATDVEGAIDELAGEKANTADAVMDGDAAGGALDGTFPNPGLASGVAGAGLAEAANVLSVNVDDATIEINADTLRVKAGGIGANEIGANAVGSSELADNAVDTAAIQDGAVSAVKVAADVATQAELDAHVNDAADAHDASSISFTPAGTIAATDVQAAIEEVASEAGGGGGLFDAVAIIRDEKAAGTEGGAATTGSFQTRTLQTEHYDPDGIVSISANQFTLGAGTYLIRARAPFYETARTLLKIRNVTDSSDAIIGQPIFVSNGGNDSTMAHLCGVVTIAGSKAFELQYRCGSTSGTASGKALGVEANFGVNEIYAEVEILRIA